MLLIRSIFALIVLRSLNTVRNYQMPCLSSDYYITHAILPTPRPTLRVLPSNVSERTASSSLCVKADFYRWITHNKQKIMNHSPCSSQVE
ncbi:hypothetical protein Y032_0557g3392 [Ancylostoma ceylanicum]|uniref:Secreted protein n=1 Tax=Ancylostoma ceylanicum TaxID=53326 RepID=A0A016WQ95_9BILA|nr:hypothetical protein Y032_0557g3392 [Ancylostoma ceylanicum]